MSAHAKSFGWPAPREGPELPNTYDQSSNPVLRGVVLAAFTKILRSSTLVQGVLWKQNQFDRLKTLPKLAGYEPRYDPTVVPAASDGKQFEVSTLDQVPVRKDRDAYYTAGDYAEAYRSGKLTPTIVIRSLLSRIQRQNDLNNRYAVAYLQVMQRLVLAAAEDSTERWARGQPLSPLDGVPVAVKDEVDLAGYSRCLGSSLDMTNPQGTSAWCVQKWEEAGAIVIGKTNMYEFGLDTSGGNTLHGTPLMPHNEAYYPGGSSSGSAVTVAQGICPIALGADGGGSIRVPSSFCGVYGLKPSHGRISARPTQDLAPSVGVCGPMASDLDSLEIAYRVMAQADPQNHTSRSFPDPLIHIPEANELRAKTIGICRDWIARADLPVYQMYQKAIDHYCEKHGYTTVDITIPYLPEGQKAHAMTILTEITAGVPAGQLKKLSYPCQLLLSTAGSHAKAQDLLAAQRLRNLMMQHLSWLWTSYPDMLIVTPTTPTAGWQIQKPSDVQLGYGVSNADQSLRTMEYVYLANWTGCPAITRPMGYAEGNVPVGLMAMGQWGSEEQLIDWAREGEDLLTQGFIQRPSKEGTWVDVLQNC